jgi:hypothetical protein
MTTIERADARPRAGELAPAHDFSQLTSDD